MTCPPSLQQWEGMIHQLPSASALAKSGFQPPASIFLVRGGQAVAHRQAGERQQAERGVRETQSKEEGTGKTGDMGA